MLVSDYDYLEVISKDNMDRRYLLLGFEKK